MRPYPIEVKLRYDSKQPVPSGLKSFLNAYPSEFAFVIDLEEFHMRKFNDTIIYANTGLGHLARIFIDQRVR